MNSVIQVKQIEQLGVCEQQGYFMLGVLVVIRAQLINYKYVSFVSTYSSQSFVGGQGSIFKCQYLYWSNT